MIESKNILRTLTRILLLISITLSVSACTPDNKLYTASETQTHAAAPSTIISPAYTSSAVETQAEAAKVTSTEVIKSGEEYQAQEKPLIAAIPDKNIFLYGLKDGGVILHYNNIDHFYDWNYLTPRFILPRMELTDFDGDSKEELAVILYTGSGTGVSIEELHIVKVSEKELLSDDPKDKNYMIANEEYFKDYFYTDYAEQLEKQVKLKTRKKGNSLWADITVGKKVSSFVLENPENDIDNSRVSFGNIVRFEFKDKRIHAQFAVGAIRKSYAFPDYIGEINSEVEFSKGKFTLKKLTFQKYGDS